MLEELTSTYAVRNKRKQKVAFLEYARKEFEELGYVCEIQEGRTIGIKSQNLVIGDVGRASIIVGAHYDTPRTMLLPIRGYLNKIFVTIFFQLLPILITFGVTYALNMILDIPGWGNFAIAYVLIYLMMFCLKNKNNANDNSSGVSGVFETAKRIPKDMRGRVAFVLFDNEEWGMLGSMAFAAKYETKNRFVIVMDCIGVGEPLVLFKADDEIPARKLASVHMAAKQEKANLCISDNKSFSHAVMVSAFKEDGIGMYLDKIHTNADTYADKENIDRVAIMTSSYICNSPPLNNI